jgi:hypothetical protein
MADRALQRAAHRRQELTGEDHQAALAAVRHARTTTYDDGSQLDPAELGVWALPSNATHEERARDEATWRATLDLDKLATWSTIKQVLPGQIGQSGDTVVSPEQEQPDAGEVAAQGEDP